MSTKAAPDHFLAVYSMPKKLVGGSSGSVVIQGSSVDTSATSVKHVVKI